MPPMMKGRSHLILLTLSTRTLWSCSKQPEWTEFVLSSSFPHGAQSPLKAGASVACWKEADNVGISPYYVDKGVYCMASSRDHSLAVMCVYEMGY